MLVRQILDGNTTLNSHTPYGERWSHCQRRMNELAKAGSILIPVPAEEKPQERIVSNDEEEQGRSVLGPIRDEL